METALRDAALEIGPVQKRSGKHYFRDRLLHNRSPKPSPFNSPARMCISYSRVSSLPEAFPHCIEHQATGMSISTFFNFQCPCLSRICIYFSLQPKSLSPLYQYLLVAAFRFFSSGQLALCHFDSACPCPLKSIKQVIIVR